MKNFQTYKHPTLGSEAVKLGFSWPAFFFGGFWMIASGLWGKLGLWFVLYCIAAAIEIAAETVTDQALYDAISFISLIGYFALWLIPAFKGNAWRRAKLLSRGYELTGTSHAETKNGAIAQAAHPSAT